MNRIIQLSVNNMLKFSNVMQQIGVCSSIIQSTAAVRQFQTSAALNYAEPLKAKKRIDPAVVAARESRKRKRIEKEIKKLEKFGRKLKPIEETEPERAVMREIDKRKRPVVKESKQKSDDEYFLKKEWSTYVSYQRHAQMEQINKALKSQEFALKELKRDNLTLYNSAIQLDADLVPYVRDGPVYTPPVVNYDPPEGDYLDVTKLYDRK